MDVGQSSVVVVFVVLVHVCRLFGIISLFESGGHKRGPAAFGGQAAFANCDHNFRAKDLLQNRGVRIKNCTNLFITYIIYFLLNNACMR